MKKHFERLGKAFIEHIIGCLKATNLYQNKEDGFRQNILRKPACDHLPILGLSY